MKKLAFCLVTFFSILFVFGINKSFSAPEAHPAKIAVSSEFLEGRAGRVLQITVDLLVKAEGVRIFTINNPNRVVVDIQNARVSKNQNIPIKGSHSVELVRLGAHPDKLRIVLDVLGEKLPLVTWRSEGNKIYLSIPEPPPGEALTEAKKTPKEEPTKKPIAQETEKAAPPTVTSVATSTHPFIKPSATVSVPAVTATKATIVITSPPTQVPTTSVKLQPTHEPVPVATLKPIVTAEVIPTKPLATAIPKVSVTVAAPIPTEKPVHTATIAAPTPTEKVIHTATSAPSPTHAPISTATSAPTKTPKVIPSSTPTERATSTATKPPATPTKQPPTATPTSMPTVTIASTPTPIQTKASASPVATLPAAASATGAVPTQDPESFAVGDVNDGAIVFREFLFDYLQPGRIPLLKLELSAPKAQLEISKADPKTYKLVIANCKLAGQYLTLPQFPPADFVGFNLVSAKQVRKTVEITLVVEPNTTIGTFVKGTQIWIKRL